MSLSWMPIHGHFETKDNGGLIFHGSPAENELQTEDQENRALGTIGIVLSNQELADGSVSANVTFKGMSEAASCEFIIRYDHETSYHLAAGITSFRDVMFAIREWSGAPRNAGEAGKWQIHASSGDRRNIEVGKTFHICVNKRGSRIELIVNGVPVAAASIPSLPTLHRRVGIWCLNNANIEINDVSISSSKPQAFVVMQFSEPFNGVYSEVVRGICESFGIQAIRADEVYGPGLIIQDVIDQITQAQIIIADITPLNANVYFEVGYARAMNKPIILLAQKGTTLPFDVSAFRVLFYEDSIAGKAAFERNLKMHLKAIFGER